MVSSSTITGAKKSLPDLRVHDDRRIEAFDIVAAMHHVAPPGLFDVVAQFDAERAVIIKAVVTAVDFGGRENESAALAKADNFFHETITGCWSFHKPSQDGD